MYTNNQQYLHQLIPHTPLDQSQDWMAGWARGKHTVLIRPISTRRLQGLCQAIR